MVERSRTALTAYTRNFQSTVIGLGQRVGVGGVMLAPWQQSVRTLALVVAWPAAIGLAMLFLAWWKAVALVVRAFVVLVPVTGSFIPRPMSRHYRERIRSDLARRIARGGRDAPALRTMLGQLDALSPKDPT